MKNDFDIVHTSLFGDLKVPKGNKARSSIYSAGLPEGMSYNGDGELVQTDDDGNETVVITNADFAKHKGKKIREILSEKGISFKG